MQVAGRLGIRYIWIDSLCIIQEGDNDHDWENEAASMSKVYTNSFCNISADWASESKGLFITRSLAQFKLPEVMLRVSTGKSSATDTYQSYITIEYDKWKQQISDSPLNARGWFLQERILAPRNIRFCLREVFWECCQMVACETYPNELPDNLMFSGENTGLKRFELNSDELLRIKGKMREGTNLNRHQLYNHAWTGIINQYSKCQLTVPSDKLVAISGIARFFKELIDDTYILGFWSKSLSLQLAWTKNHNYHEKDQPESTPSSGLPYRSPTFSWASSDGIFMSSPLECESEVLPTVKCIYHRPLTHCRSDDDIEVHEDIFGPINAPTVELKITGNLKRMTLRENYTYLLAVPCVSADVNTESGSDCYADAWFDDERNNQKSSPLLGQDIFYIPLLKQQREDYMNLCCLILQLVEREMGRFARIGMIYVPKDRNLDLYLQSQESEESLPCWAYDSSRRLHTLYIV